MSERPQNPAPRPVGNLRTAFQSSEGGLGFTSSHPIHPETASLPENHP
jgi:hypothetical protein